MVNEINTSELLELITSKKEFILLDVREDYELHYGKLPTAKWIPCSTFSDFFELNSTEFKSTYGFAIPSKSVQLIVYCRSGYRSDQIVRLLENKGFNSYNYVDGILGWADIDNSVEKY